MRSFTLALLAGLLLAQAVPAVTFDDGQVHVIDANNSFPFEDVFVENGPGGASTTLVLVPGGEIGTPPNGFLISHGQSIIQVVGGSIGRGLQAEGDSRVEIIDGTVGIVLQLLDDSELTMSGGTTGQFFTNDRSAATVTGGTFEGFGGVAAAAGGTSTLNILAGSFLSTVNVGNSASVHISGGNFADVNSQSGTASLEISGGFIQTVEGFNDASIDIRGGNILAEIVARDSSSVIIEGTGFNFPPGDISPISGTLTGILADGTPLDIDFGRASTATITLIPSVPAPSLRGEKRDTLVVDNDGDGRPDPGDIVSYRIAINNVGTADAEGSVLLDSPDLNSSLIVGSVVTTQGTVISGNGPSDTAVEVDVGTLMPGSGGVEIVFVVLVDDPFPPGVLMISNQGEVSGTNFNPVFTDDPDTPAFPDPTITQIANTQLDICERELDQCLSNPPFDDEDGDGEHDSTDACPSTPVGAEVDQAGCSIGQFCSAFPIGSQDEKRRCNRADWQNDEPATRPRDCRARVIATEWWELAWCEPRGAEQPPEGGG